MRYPETDIGLLFATRIVRLFAYGFLSVVLVLYMAQVGFSDQAIGLLLSLTLAGDAGITLWITTAADRIGRRRMLVLGAGLMVLAGGVFVVTRNPVLLMAAAVVGVISPSGNEIGPFLSIEQAALSQLVPDANRTRLFAWYNLLGSLATALGALVGGWLTQGLQMSGMAVEGAYRVVIAGYAVAGILLAILFGCLSPAVEARAGGTVSAPRILGLHRSRGVVMRLGALFALDAFAGGFIVQSFMAYWFHLKFGVSAGTLGSLFFAANLLAGLSALAAVPLARRIGLIRTMVFTHIPSNVLLCLVPLMPTLPWAIGILLVRFSISQMDVPTRQSFTMAAVEPDERSAASGITSIARSVGAAASPMLSGALIAVPCLVGAPFYLAGGLKIVYDLLLYRGFRAHPVPEA